MGKPIEPGCTVVVVGSNPPEWWGCSGTAIRWIPKGTICMYYDGRGLFASEGEWLCDFHGKSVIAPPPTIRRIDDYDPNADELEQEKLDNETV